MWCGQPCAALTAKQQPLIMHALPHVCPCVHAKVATNLVVCVCTCAHLSMQFIIAAHFTPKLRALAALDRSPEAPPARLRAPGPCTTKKSPCPATTMQEWAQRGYGGGGGALFNCSGCGRSSGSLPGSAPAHQHRSGRSGEGQYSFPSQVGDILQRTVTESSCT